jgi:two-component system, OmpR family, sensor histidine kinase VicK
VRRLQKRNKIIASTTNKTIVLTDPKDIMSNAAALFSNVKERIDCSADSNAPYSHFMLKPVRDGYIQLKNRGIKVRFITEITKENLYYSQELMKAVELRHLDGIKGNFGISDGVEYRASPTSKQDETPSEYIISTMKPFVEQQQYVLKLFGTRRFQLNKELKKLKKEQKENLLKQSEIHLKYKSSVLTLSQRQKRKYSYSFLQQMHSVVKRKQEH